MNVASHVRRFAPPGEGFHVATAGVGFLGAILAWAWLASRAVAGGPALWAAHAFGATLAFLFVATALHHARPSSELWRRIDHASVFVAMAGTAAPLCVRVLPPKLAFVSWGALAAMALAGAALKLSGRRLAPRHNILAHLALLAPLAPLAWALPTRLGLAGAGLFVAAVGTLTVGAILDARRRPILGMGAHAAFHVLSLLACVAAFALIAM